MYTTKSSGSAPNFFIINEFEYNVADIVNFNTTLLLAIFKSKSLCCHQPPRLFIQLQFIYDRIKSNVFFHKNRDFNLTLNNKQTELENYFKIEIGNDDTDLKQMCGYVRSNTVFFPRIKVFKF